MHTGTKVAIGVVGVAAVGLIGYLVFTNVGGSQSSGGGAGTGTGTPTNTQTSSTTPAAQDQTAATFGFLTALVQTGGQVATVAMQNQRPPAEGAQVQNQYQYTSGK